MRYMLTAATLLIFAALIALLHVQWNWIDRMATLDEEHERRVLEFAARQFAAEFDQDVGSIISGFEHGRPENLFRSARDPHLIAGIYVAHAGDLEEIVRDAVWRKELKHRVGEPGFRQPPRTMSAIGG